MHSFIVQQETASGAQEARGLVGKDEEENSTRRCVVG